MFISVLVIQIVVFAAVIGYLIRSRNSADSRWFIERQQMQSKIDTLTERILQQAGQPIDLNKAAREKFKASLKGENRPFNKGWKTDAPATPPLPPKETKS